MLEAEWKEWELSGIKLSAMQILPIIYLAATPRALAFKIMRILYEKSAMKHSTLVSGVGKIKLIEKGVDVISGELKWCIQILESYL